MLWVWHNIDNFDRKCAKDTWNINWYKKRKGVGRLLFVVVIFFSFTHDTSDTLHMFSEQDILQVA